MFEKDVLAKNIQYLAAKQGKKIGELEKAADVSPGYVSRMLKETGKNSAPIVELMLVASKEFGVSVDDLISRRMDAVHPSERYLKEFFGKLKDDTLAGNISWTIELKETLAHRGDEFRHPRFQYDGELARYSYSSPFDSQNMMGTLSAHAVVKDKLLYIVPVEGPKGEDNRQKGFELYFAYSAEEQSVENIACVWSGDSLFETVSDMLALAEETNSRINLSPSVRTTIDRFMGKFENVEPPGTFTESDDKLPF